MKSINAYLGLGVAVALSFTACNSNTKDTKSTAGKTESGATIEPLTNDPNASKQHLFLRLSNEHATDSSVVYTAKSLFEKDTVGLQIEVLKNIKAGLREDGTVDEKAGFVRGSIKFTSLGQQSDAFVKALGTMFKSPTTGAMTSNTILPTVFSSNKKVIDLNTAGTYSFKLFLDNGAGQPAEVFAVLDTYRKSFEITEKDSTFRSQVIAAFEGK